MPSSVLPSPDYAFGSYYSLTNYSNSDVKFDLISKLITFYKDNLGYPLDGFALDDVNLNDY